MIDDVGSGAQQYLLGFTDVTSLLGAFAATDPNPANAGLPWLFKDDLLTVMEGTSAAAVVCSPFGGWSAPIPLSSFDFERLSVEVYVDPLRDSANNITESSGATKQRGMAVFAAVKFRLHRTDPDTVTWGDLVTTGCQLLTKPQFTKVPDGDGLLVGQSFYGVTCGGWLDAVE